MDVLDLTVGVTGTFTPQKILAKFVRTMAIAPPNVHFLDPEVLEKVDAQDPEQMLIIPLRCLDRRGFQVGAVTIEEA